MEPRVVSGDYRGQLCESPVWDADAECLWFVDVLSGVGRCRPADGDVKTWATPNWVGCVALRAKGLVAALADATDHSGGKLCALMLREESSDAECELTFAPLNLEPCSCPNDGAVDAAGRLWVGSKTLLPHGKYCKDSAGFPSPDPGGPTPAGRLFVVAGADDVRRCDEVGAVTVSNGIGWSPDSTKMYYVDSPSKCVLAFDFSAASGNVTNKRLFADTSSMVGVPDGLAVDADGGVWVALWDGAAVAHFSSAGVLLRRISLPVSRPTSVAFGRGHELYITTCSFDAGDQAPLLEPLAGAIFVIDAGVAGAPVARCCF